jgi:hypothetical protein
MAILSVELELALALSTSLKSSWLSSTYSSARLLLLVADIVLVDWL